MISIKNEQPPSFLLSLKEMYHHLLNINQEAPTPVLSMQPSFPHLYKPELKYEYHIDASEHNIETCHALY